MTKLIEPQKQEKNIFSDNTIALVVFLIASIYAKSRIINPDIRILFSLGLVVASGVGKYGLAMIRKYDHPWKGIINEDYHSFVYMIMFVVGVWGLIF